MIYLLCGDEGSVSGGKQGRFWCSFDLGHRITEGAALPRPSLPLAEDGKLQRTPDVAGGAQQAHCSQLHSS
jgi:hypothetical protein